MNEDEIMKKGGSEREGRNFLKCARCFVGYKNKVIIIYNQAVCAKDKQGEEIE
jgi:hypothetical protein